MGRGFMRWGWILALPIAAVVGVAIAYPAVAAAGCPSCYGFTAIDDDTFVEPGMAPETRAATRAVLGAARARVRDFYGSLTARPRILICATETCYGRFGGGSRGLALLDRALFLSPRGTDVVIAAHELSHIELHHRLGPIATFDKAVPQWFDEGLAVVVSDDPRYLRSDRADRCRIEPTGAMPRTRAAWIETAESADLYAQAACAVSRWLGAHGGPSAVPRLANAVASGASFSDSAR